MEKTEDFLNVISYLPSEYETLLKNISDSVKSEITEIRLRSDMPIMLYSREGANFVYKNSRVSLIYRGDAVRMPGEKIKETFNRLCDYSVHTNAQNINEGFLTLKGGHRAGICGTCVCDENKNIVGIRDISSINLRIAKDFLGCAEEIYEKIFRNGLCSIIIGGAPSTGKTTILRDLSRLLSGEGRGDFYKVAIADERSEIAGSLKYRREVGFCDVLSGYPKEKAIDTALRTLSPQMIVCDEIGTITESERICEGLNSGVCFTLSAHMQNKEDIFLRPQIKKLIKSGAFSHLVMLDSARNPGKIKKIYSIKELLNESSRGDISGGDICPFGLFPLAENGQALSGA